MSRFIVYPCKSGWGLRKVSRQAPIGFFKLRRLAISEGRKAAGREGVLTVHDSQGRVVIRIPELHVEKVAASVHITNAPLMSPGGRRRIAAWLTRHAKMLVKEGKNYSSRFRGRYYYESEAS